jgi:hypothetical protein
VAGAQQVMDDGGQPEAGARALGALIENRHLRLAIVVEWPLRLHFDQGRLEHAIAEIERVRARVEYAFFRRAATTDLSAYDWRSVGASLHN